MRFSKIGLFVIILISYFPAFTQDYDGSDSFSHDISINYGLFPALISENYQSELSGTTISLDYACFFYNKMGIRTGLTSITNFEGTKGFYKVPIAFSYRTKAQRDYFISSDADSFGELIFDIILGLMPKHAEYIIGINLGYIEPDNNLGMVSYNGAPFYNEGYLTQYRFFASADAGLRLTYRIYRFGIVFSPLVSYVLTNNFEFYSEQSSTNGFSPNWFMNMTIGLSYRF
jgi:hypothetical protein